MKNIFSKLASGVTSGKRIYLDYASLTPIDKRVLRTIFTYSNAGGNAMSNLGFMNPSSIYREGVAARKVLQESRTKCASLIKAHADEIIFTGSGTEANALAISGVIQSVKAAGSLGNAKPHIIVSAIEHSSVLENVNQLKKYGCDVDVLPVLESGIVDVSALKKKIRPETVLISIMTVNNEIGTVQPIDEIMKVIRHARKSNSPSNSTNFPLFHTDACQAMYEIIDVEKSGVDLLTLDGHKIYGPRGIGMLYVRRGVKLSPIIHGGGQESGLRSGTENLPAIAGFAHALEIAVTDREKENARLSELQKYFEEKLTGYIKNSANQKAADIRIYGCEVGRSPHITNVSLPIKDNEYFVLQLDAMGIACSTKSSCLRDEDESYVLKAIDGKSSAKNTSAVRFSFGRQTTRKEIDQTLEIIGELLKKLI